MTNSNGFISCRLSTRASPTAQRCLSSPLSSPTCRAPSPPPASRASASSGRTTRAHDGEAAGELGLTLSVLASAPTTRPRRPSTTCTRAATDTDAIRRLAERVEVITFDHELVDLEALEALEAEGVTLRPSAQALRFAVDKAFQRRAFRQNKLLCRDFSSFVRPSTNGWPLFSTRSETHRSEGRPGRLRRTWRGVREESRGLPRPYRRVSKVRRGGR